MPSQIKIEKSDSKAADKLLYLIGEDELVISDASEDTQDNQKTVIKGNVSFFSQNNLAATVTEYSKDSLTLNVSGTASPISLSDIGSLLNLNPIYSSLYSQISISNLSLSVSTSSQDNSNYDCLVIQGSVTIGADQDFLAIDSFSITDIALSISIRNAISSGNKDIKVILRIYAKLEDKDLQVIFALPVGGKDLWQLKLIAPGLDFSFQKLAALTMGSDVFNQLPAQISSIPSFSLSALEINFNPAAESNKLHDIGFEIQSDGSWELIPDSILTIKNISLSALVSGSSNYQGSVNAIASIDNKLDINISIPIPISSGALSFYANDVFQLNDLSVFSNLLSGTGFGNFLSSVNFGDRFSMGVGSLSIDLDMSSKSISSFSMDGQASFCTAFIGLFLDLDARLSVTYDKSRSDGQQFSFTLDAQAKLLVSGETFSFEGKYDSSEKIWAFNGSASGPISLTNLTDNFGISNRYLPETINKLSISEIYANFSTAAGNPCGFSCKTTIPLSGTNYEFTIAINKNDSDSWSLSAESNFGQPLLLNNIIDSLLSLFDLTATLPDSVKNLNIGLSKISFSYDSSTHGIDFEFTLSTSLPYQSITGSAINTGDNSPKNFSSFKLLKSNSEANKDMKLVLTIEPGLKLNDFLGDELPIPSDTTLKELDFTLDISSSPTTSSSKYSFATSFSGSDASSNVVKITGILNKETAQDKPVTTYFGGSLSSSNKISLTGDLPISMDITDLFVAKISHTPVSEADSFTVFGSDLNVKGDIDLGSLPVVGDFLKEAKFSFNALRIVYANAQIKADELTGINGFLAQINVAPLLTPQSTVANNSSTPASFAQGFSLQGALVLGDNGEVIPLHAGFSGGQSGAKSVPIKDTPAPQTPLDVNNATSPATPAPVGKKFGPLSIECVSLGLKGSEVCLTVSGGLLIGPLGVDFIGFEISSPVNKFSPAIGLHGLGLAINKPPLALNGLFVNSKIDVPNGTDKEGKVITKQIDGYSGSLAVGYKDYALTAMGSYAKLPDGVTSIFIYGFLGAPLGGLPGILMITGVAAGFGYNRAFNLPSPESINTFSLIQPVIPGNTSPVDFNAMNLDFMPQEGSFWGAVGIRVESFKMIESFVLLALKFNVVLEIDILGIASMQFPVPDVGSSKPPLARIGIGLVARILPERGIVAVNGVFLPGSYIFDPNAVITGGFAMLTVFKDQADGQWSGAKEGDFILTLGGYGPVYKPEAYYPQVSRLEMNWKVSDALLIKADTYFAITPQAMMVGGHMVADFQEGGDFSIHAVFTVGADFIIYWKPYRYLGHMYADLAVAASINVLTIHTHVDFDLSADLKIWGPSFSGYASVSVHALVSFTVCIAFGEDEQIPQPISWDDFSSGFLPALDKILSVNIGRGLIASQSSPAKESIPAINVVNAKELVVILGTAIPVKVVSENTGVKHANTAFGIKPMANTEDDFKSVLTLNVSKDGKDMSSDELSTRFSFEPITKNMPSALWQPADKDKSGKIPDNDDSSLINDLLSGVRISAIDPVAGTSYTISVNKEDIISTASATKGASFSYGTGFSRAA